MRTGEYLEQGQIIKELRLKTGLSVYKCCRKLHISGNYLSLIERGVYAPSDQVLFNICDYFDVDPDYIFNLYGRVVPPTDEQLKKMPSLRNVVTDISVDSRLNIEEKDRIIKEIYRLANDIIGGD